MKSLRIIVSCVSLTLVLQNCGGSSGGGDAEAAAFALIGNISGSSYISPCDTLTPETGRGVFVADELVSAPGSTGIGYKNANCAKDGIRGQGEFNGSLDVYTMGASGSGASIILGWSGGKVQPSTGIDFIVYENPFFIGVQNNSNPFNAVFMEPLIIEVGNDQTNWCGWNPAYTNADPNTFVNNPTYWNRFAGITPVAYNQDTNPMTVAEVFDTDIVNGGGGGDGFDLADSNFGSSGTGCDSTLKNDIQANGFTYIKISAAKTILSTLPIDSAHSNPDIDGVVAKSVSP
ncbi:LIC_13355 family lipoprotein [Leptospira semungkisensis]|uniref:LIC_13355 family lipoprotein n=1 Tax=Leptospira semungkisensis TaxID=2484985 RepID=A0A4V3JCT0_9LEPT|nr:LIC_13355 family lipoprotein [Leptospira semungkisensis]TGK07279.1 LIC_13355 family lipoprotein [Leptospira semungkisensis]